MMTPTWVEVIGIWCSVSQRTTTPSCSYFAWPKLLRQNCVDFATNVSCKFLSPSDNLRAPIFPGRFVWRHLYESFLKILVIALGGCPPFLAPPFAHGAWRAVVAYRINEIPAIKWRHVDNVNFQVFILIIPHIEQACPIPWYQLKSYGIWTAPRNTKEQGTQGTRTLFCYRHFLDFVTKVQSFLSFFVVTNGFLYSWYLHLPMTLRQQWPENPCIDACCSHDDGGPRFPRIFVYRCRYQFQYEVSCRFSLLLPRLPLHHHPFAHDRTVLSMHTMLTKSLFTIKWRHPSRWRSKGWPTRLTNPRPVPMPGAIKSDYIEGRKADEVTTPVSQPTKFSCKFLSSLLLSADHMEGRPMG